MIHSGWFTERATCLFPTPSIFVVFWLAPVFITTVYVGLHAFYQHIVMFQYQIIDHFKHALLNQRRIISRQAFKTINTHRQRHYVFILNINIEAPAAESWIHVVRSKLELAPSIQYRPLYSPVEWHDALHQEAKLVYCDKIPTRWPMNRHFRNLAQLEINAYPA